MKYCDSADAQERGVELGLEGAVLGFEVEQRDFHGRRTLPIANRRIV